MPEGVRLSVFLDGVAFPLGPLGKNGQGVVAGVVALVGDQQVDQLLEVHLVLGDAAAHAGDVGGVQRCVSGVAAEHAEQADAFVRPDRGALPLDGVHGAGDGGREPDAVLGVSHVVVHGLGHGDHMHALAVEFGRVAQRVVAADGHQVIQGESLDVLEDRRGDVEHRRGHALLGGFLLGKFLPFQNRRDFLHLGRIGARAMQVGAARAIDGSGILPVEGKNVAGPAGGVLEVDVRQPFPAPANADDLAPDLASAVDHRLDHGIQSWDVAASREDTNALRSHENS